MMREAFSLNMKDTGPSFLISWNPQGNLFALGSKGRVHIMDYSGQEINSFEVITNDYIKYMDWNREGSTLALLQDKTGDIVIWDDMTKECSTLDMPISDPTFLTWSKVKSHLAIGTASGNVLLYKEFAEAPISIVSVLPSGITSGLWGCNDCFLAVASVSTKTLAVLEENGENTLHLQMKYPAVSLSFSSTSQRAGTAITGAICVNSGGKVLYVKDMESRLCAPLEMSFHYSRGAMVNCIWIDSMILVGFSSGELLLLSAFFSDQMQVKEIWSKTFTEVAPILDLKFIPFNKKILACGKEIFTFFECFERSCVPISTHPVSSYHPHNISMSEEGSILSVARLDSKLVFYHFHSQLVTCAANGNLFAFIASPLCLAYGNAETSKVTSSLPLPFEPSIVAVGPSYVAVGNGSMILVYSKDTKKLIFKKENLKRVCHLNLSSKYLVFFNDLKLYALELVESLSIDNEIGVVMSFEEGEVTYLSMTEHFIIFGTSQGAVEFVSLAQRKRVDSLRYQHPCAIKYLAPSSNGTRILLVDVSGKAMLYIPSAQISLQLPEFPNKFDSIIWDVADTNIVNVIDDINIHCYIYIHQSIRGTMMSKLGQVHVDLDGGITIHPMPFQLRLATKPIVCCNGEFTFFSDNMIRSATSPFYCSGSDGGDFASFLALLKFEDCWRVALKVNESHFWLAIASKALEVLDIDVAIRAYRFLNDAGMVLSLEKLSFVEDKNLLAGFILMIFMDYDTAQNSLLNSNRIDIAIDMRLNVLHFDEALSLSSKSCQEKLIFDVSLKYGQYLESIGKSERALAMYDKAYNLGSASEIKASCDTESCTGGLARSLIRSGNFERGFKVALQIENIPIKAACAELLLSYNQIVEAAAIYESCYDFDKAAELYLKVNHVTFLGKIQDKIISSKLLAKIGMALEDAGRNRLAMEAYGRAGEVNSFVRINLRTGGHPKAAIEMVKNHKSIESAKILIDYCLQQASVDYTSVIELLIMSAEHERAFSIAKENNLMEAFEEQSVIDSNIAIIVGKYYEENGILGKAGQFYSVGGQYDRAIRLYLESGEDYIKDAIRLTEATKDISHVSTVIDYLTSERQGKATDPLLILKVFSSLENFGEAVVYALSVAKRYQENGDYSNAHIVIASLICTMERKNTQVPQKLRSKFTLYHSYKLIKFHAKRGSHKDSASLLLRVIENLDDFPHHKYELLVNTVIECMEAGFLKSAHTWATYIYKEKEIKERLEGAVKKKVETCLRRQTAHEEGYKLSPSPFSGIMIPDMLLTCPETKKNIPMCILTGRHMELEDWCFCPVSGMPALCSEYLKYMESLGSADGCGKDPIFGQNVDLIYLSKISEEQARQYLNKYIMIHLE